MQNSRRHSKIQRLIVAGAVLMSLSKFTIHTVLAEDLESEVIEEIVDEIVDEEFDDKESTTKTSQEDVTNQHDIGNISNGSSSEQKVSDNQKDSGNTNDENESLDTTDNDEQPELNKPTLGTNDEESSENNMDDNSHENADIYSPYEVRQASMTVMNKGTTNTHYTTSFINGIAPIAMELGKEFGLYPSVIIAQAALESGWGGKSPALPADYVLSLPPNYNLFGVKGEYEGSSIAVVTKEFDKKLNDFIDVVDYFKKYPSYRESILDYVNKMRYNLSTKDPYVYSGVWIENTKSYKDATASLTGLYATDPQYHEKLNKIIENYQLMQYDPVIETVSSTNPPQNLIKITETKATAYRALIELNTSIYNNPGSSEIIHNSNNLSSRAIIVREEALVGDKVWVSAEIGGKVIGWVLKENITPSYHNIIETNKVAYRGTIIGNGQSFFSRPAWTEGNYLLGSSDKYKNSTITVSEEIITSNGKYVSVSLGGKSLGWINVAGIDVMYDDVLRNPVVSYNAEIVDSSQNIYDRPAWTRGNKLVSNSSQYVGELLTVTEEMVTTRGTYAKISHNGNLLGWINKAGINGLYEEVISNSLVAYRAEVIDVSENFFSTPIGTKNNYLTTNSINYVGQILTVKEESVTSKGTYSLVYLGQRELGWINKDNLKGIYDSVQRNPIVAYRAEIADSTQNFYSRPAWTANNYLTNYSKEFIGELLTVKEEMFTNRGVYSKVYLNDVELGWINKFGLYGLYDSVKSNPIVAYRAKIADTSQNFYSRPAWTENNYLTTNSRNYVGELLTAKEEIVTNRGTYAKIFLGNKELGWINKAGLEGLYDTIIERNVKSYNARVSDTNQNFYSMPAWTKGNYLTTNSRAHVGKNLLISEEIRTSGGIYAKVISNGKELGWINKLGLRPSLLVYLDPGHGGNPSKGGNPGAVYNGVKEQDLNLTISLQVRNQLEKLGYTVVMSREDNNNSYHDHWRDDLYARPAHANALGADLLVSVHHNASGTWDSSMNGIETYIYGVNSDYPPLPENAQSHNDPTRMSESRKLANAIHKDLIKNTGANDRGVKSGAFIAVREAKMPAVLLELGFMSNRAELNKLTTTSYQQKLVNGIVTGIHNYFLL